MTTRAQRDPIYCWELQLASVRRRLTERARTAEGLARQAGNADPKVGLRAVVALRALLEELERDGVRNARLLEWSWRDVSDVLGMSRQAVHRRHATPRPQPRRGARPPWWRYALDDA